MIPEEKIPDAIWTKMKQEAISIADNSNGSWNDMIMDGMDFGYSLKSSELKALKDENERLKDDFQTFKGAVDRADKLYESLEVEPLRKRIKELEDDGWISVEDDLPKAIKRGFDVYMTDYVGVWVNGDHEYESGFGTGRYCHQRKTWFVTLRNLFTAPSPTVTHWRYLPSPPKQ